MAKKKEYKIVFVPYNQEPLTKEQIEETNRKHKQVLIDLIKLLPNNELVNI